MVEPARYCYRPAALAEQLRSQCRDVICRQHPGILWQCDDQCGDDPADSDIYSCGKYGLRRKTQIGQGLDVSQEWLTKFSESVHSYLAIKTAISLLTGLLIFIWLTIFGVDYAVLWGLVAFLLNFVPTVGSFIAAVPAVLLAAVQLGVFSGGLNPWRFCCGQSSDGQYARAALDGQRFKSLAPGSICLSGALGLGVGSQWACCCRFR